MPPAAKNFSPNSSCFVCGISFEEHGSAPRKAYYDPYLASAFYQCLRLDSEVGTVSNAPFCRQCKVGLEVWKSVQEEIEKLNGRSREIHDKFVLRVLRARKNCEEKDGGSGRSPRKSKTPAKGKGRRTSNRRSTTGRESTVTQIRDIVYQEYGESLKKERKSDEDKTAESGNGGNRSVRIKRESVDEDEDGAAGSSKKVNIECPRYVSCGVQTKWGKLKTKDTQTEQPEIRNRRCQTKLVSQESCGTQTTKLKGTGVSSSTQTIVAQASRGVQVRQRAQVNDETQTEGIGKTDRRTQTDYVDGRANAQTEGVKVVETESQGNEHGRAHEGDKKDFRLIPGPWNAICTTPLTEANENRRSLVREVERNRFLYQDKIPFERSNGMYGCGLCPGFTSRLVLQMLKHMREKHTDIVSFANTKVEAVGHSDQADRESQVGRERSSDAVETNQTASRSSCDSSLNQSSTVSPAASIPQTSPSVVPVVTPPKAASQPHPRVKGASLVKFIYRNKVPFDCIDGTFRCGICSCSYSGDIVSAKKQILRHIRREHKKPKTKAPTPVKLASPSVNKNYPEPQGASKGRFCDKTIKKLGPGKYLYDKRVPFYLHYGRFTCGLCAMDDLVFWARASIIRHIKLRHKDAPIWSRKSSRVAKNTDPTPVSNGGSASERSDVEVIEVQALGPDQIEIPMEVNEVQSECTEIPVIEIDDSSPSEDSDSEATRAPSTSSNSDIIPSMIIEEPTNQNRPQEPNMSPGAHITEVDDDDDVVILEVQKSGTPSAPPQENTTEQEQLSVSDDEMSEPEQIEEEEEDTLIAEGPGKFKYGRCGVALQFGKYLCRECFQVFVGPPGVEELKKHVRTDHKELAPKTFRHVEETGSGNFLYRKSVTFSQFGRDFKCGACGGIEDEKYRMLKHIYLVHADKLKKNVEQTHNPPPQQRPENKKTTRKSNIRGTSNPENNMTNPATASEWPHESAVLDSMQKQLPRQEAELSRRVSTGSHQANRESSIVCEISPGIFTYCQEAVFYENDTHLKCGACSYEVAKIARWLMFQHLREVHLGDKVLRRIGPTKYVYRNSLTFEWTNGRYQCEGCSYANVSIQRMLEHISSKHGGDDASREPEVVVAGAQPRSQSPQKVPDPGSLVQVKLDCLTPKQESEPYTDPIASILEPLDRGFQMQNESAKTRCVICGFTGSFFDFFRHMKNVHGRNPIPKKEPMSSSPVQPEMNPVSKRISTRSAKVAATTHDHPYNMGNNSESPFIATSRRSQGTTLSASNMESGGHNLNRTSSSSMFGTQSHPGFNTSSSSSTEQPGVFGSPYQDPLRENPLWSSAITSMPATAGSEAVGAASQLTKTYPCRLCTRQLPSLVEYGRHVRQHMGDKPFFCTKCPLRFQTHMELDTHVKLTNHNY